jgi:4-hydroxy-3-methylbut-2-enyl diphosphate reductase
MEIEKADEIGFCTGVRRAIKILERAAKELGNMQTLGPIVHNQQVVDKLAASGVTVAETLDQVHGDTIAISSHGASPQVLEEAKARGLNIVDTTCPFVRRAQNAVKKLYREGLFVIVFGDETHPEVQGVLGYAKGNGLATIAIPEFDNLPQRIGLLSQTTQSFPGFSKFVSSFIDHYLANTTEIRVINTICNATRRHQQAALELANHVDLMLVVGSMRSANTRRLAEICSPIVPTHHIETARDIDPAWWNEQQAQRVGVTAGASTPDDTIEEVIESLENIP